MRKLIRKQEKKLKGLNSIIKSSLVLGLTLTLAGQTYAQAVSMSDNLPVPNYVNGASLKYNSGLGINSSTSNLSAAAQAQAAKAADSSKSLNINVQAAAADLKYNSFNVGQNSKVQFNFSNQNQVALNRITSVGAGSISRILGNITQTGQGGAVLLINPNGILFSRDSSVSLNSFMGSTLKYKSSDLNKKTITLVKSEQEPRGIQMHWGSIIKTDKGAVFASNGIYNDGADISAQSGNIQLITGDGVTFTYNEALKPNIVSQEDVQASTVAPEDVKYQPYGYSAFTGSESSIYIEKAKISGENLNFISKLNFHSNDPLKNIINLDGIIEAKQGAISESGNISIYSGGSSKVNINTDIKAAGNIKIQAKKINAEQITSGRNIKLDALLEINTDNIASGGKIEIDGVDVNTKSITADGNIQVGGVFLNTTDLTSGNNVILKVRLSGNMNAGNITALNEIIIDSNRPINCKQLNSGGNIQIDSGGTQCLDINTKGNINIFTKENETQIGNVKASGDLDIVSFGGIYTKDLEVGGIVSTYTPFGGTTTGNIVANKKVSIYTPESVITTKDIISNANVNLSAVGYIKADNIKAKDSIEIGSYRGILTTNDINAGENILVKVGEISILGDLKAKEKIYVSTRGPANIQNIEAGEDILIKASSLSTNSPDNLIKTTGYYSNILMNANEMFIEKDESAIRPSFIPSIELSYGTLILGPKSMKKVELIGTGVITANSSTTYLFSDIYNKLKTKSEVPKVAVAHLFDNPINIKATDHFLGRIKEEAQPKHFILSTSGNVDFEFTSAHPDSTLTVDHCWLNPEIIDPYDNIDITKPLIIQGYGTNDLNNEANNVKVIDATKDPDFNTFDQNFFSNNPVELIKL